MVSFALVRIGCTVAMGSSRVLVYLLLLILSTKVSSYEKTLRKIVRSQSKMVQRPFTDTVHHTAWKNYTASLDSSSYLNIFPNLNPQHSELNALQRPKISTIYASKEPGKTKINSNKKIPIFSGLNDQTPSRKILLRHTTSASFRDEPLYSQEYNNSNITDMRYAFKDYYQIPTTSKNLPLDMDDVRNQTLQWNKKDTAIFIPEESGDSVQDDLKVVGIVNPKAKFNEKPEETYSVNEKYSATEFDPYNEKADFFVMGFPDDGPQAPKVAYKLTNEPFTCSLIKETNADIDVQAKFLELNLEPKWVKKARYWSNIYESRYEALMRSPKWPPLKVILLLRSHVDTIWTKTFEEYHNDVVRKIISNVVKKLQYFEKLKFTWHEVSHLSYWWTHASFKSRVGLKRLIKSGRLEITTGGWVEPDEATTHVYGLLHQYIEGHQWLKQHLNYTPNVGWLTNSVAHSPTMAYFLSATDIKHMVITNIHYALEEYLAEYQYSDFIWLQNWDQDLSISHSSKLNEQLNKIGKQKYPRHGVLSHFLQFNFDGFKACGPKHDLCTSEYNFGKPSKIIDVNVYNVKEKSEAILEQYSKTGTISSHNVIIAPLGGPYQYNKQAEFDYQYSNYKKIMDFINTNKDIYKATVEFGTAYDYFSSITKKQKSYPTLKGDFLNFADIKSETPAYWTGFYTSRPYTKIILRRLQSTLRSAEILMSFASNFNTIKRFNATAIFQLLIKCRETTARLLDRHVASGTTSAHALKYVHNKILSTVKELWYIQEIAASSMALKPGLHNNDNEPCLHKYVYRNDEFIKPFKTVSPGDQLYIFNSLTHERTEVVELVTRFPNIRITDHNKKDLIIQINPVWTYKSDNVITISRRHFKVQFAIAIPPLSLELFHIKETYDVSQSIAAIYCSNCIIDSIGDADESMFPFEIQALQRGDVQLESYKHRLIFDEATGFLKSVIEKETSIEKPVVVDYGAFKDSYVNSGMFLFNTDPNRPLQDILLESRKHKIMLIISGALTTELTTLYGRLLQHTTKIFNLLRSPLSSAIFIESKVNYEVTPKYRELELFLSIQTNIMNGNAPELYIDNNGFQFTGRVLNMSRRIESNIYPVTTMAFIQDRKSRVTFITDHAQGVTALQEGQLVVVLDRRILFDDGKGTNEALADGGVSTHKNIILLENLYNNVQSFTQLQEDLVLPSLSATYLSNTLDYLIDIFIIDKKDTNSSHYMFLPLVKSSFPCDVMALSYRIILNRSKSKVNNPESALLTLHRQTFSCQIDSSALQHCRGESNFGIDKILRNTRAVYQTNLPGTTEGIRVINFNYENFPPMELITLRIHF